MSSKKMGFGLDSKLQTYADQKIKKCNETIRVYENSQ